MGKLAFALLVLLLGAVIAVGLLVLPGYITGQAAQVPLDSAGTENISEADEMPPSEPEWAGPAFPSDPGYAVNDSVSLTGETVVFNVTAGNFKFMIDGEDNPNLTVKLGDVVRVEFTSTEGYHDFVIAEFNAITDRVWAVNSTSVEFVADKAGEFEYFCSVGKHRDMGMAGFLTVEE